MLPDDGRLCQNFVLREVGVLRLEAGVQTLTMAPTAAVKDGMMELRAITLKKRWPRGLGGDATYQRRGAGRGRRGSP